jgi:hypothetical protein
MTEHLSQARLDELWNFDDLAESERRRRQFDWPRRAVDEARDTISKLADQ